MVNLQNEMAIDTCVENFSGAVLKVLAASNHKCRPRDDPRPPIPAVAVHQGISISAHADSSCYSRGYKKYNQFQKV